MSGIGRKNQWMLLLLSVVIVATFSGCGIGTAKFNDNSSNANNSGIAFGIGKEAVFTDGKSLFRIAQDEVTELVGIDGNIQGSVYAYDRFIYFYGALNKNDGTLKRDEGYYSWNSETGEIHKVFSFKPLALAHYKDKIYFIHPDRGNAVHMCTYEGKNMTEVSDETVMSMALDHEYIYYVSGLNLALYRMKHDGTQKEFLNTEGVLSMAVFDGRIYYKDGYNDYKFSMTDKNGKTSNVVTDGSVYSFNVTKDAIYFSGDQEGGGMFKLKIGETGAGSVLTDDIAVNINIAGEYLFYRKMTDGRLYRCHLDGSNEQLIQN